jgi:hypothetical protein
MKTNHSKDYQVFELLCKDKCGGGLVIGALNDINPVWISEGEVLRCWLFKLKSINSELDV